MPKWPLTAYHQTCRCSCLRVRCFEACLACSFGSQSCLLTRRELLHHAQPAPMAVLTARARELKVFLALKPSTKLCLKYNEAAEKLFKDFGKSASSWGIDTDSTVLYGSVVEWILQYRKGWRKFTNFKKLRAQNDDRVRYVLVGDTGEYDEECGERMVAHCPELVRGLFFHVVSEKEWRDLGERGLPLPADKAIDGRA